MEKTGNKEKIKESENGKILIKGLVDLVRVSSFCRSPWRFHGYGSGDL